MEYAIKLEDLGKFIQTQKTRVKLKELNSLDKLEEYIHNNSNNFDLEKWSWVYFKLISSNYEYKYGPPVRDILSYILRNYELELSKNRKLLSQLKKDSKFDRKYFISLLTEKLKLTFLIKSKKRAYAVETLEGLEYIHNSSHPWKKSELKRISMSIDFLNNPEHLKCLIKYGLPIRRSLIIRTLQCEHPYSFLTFDKKTVSFLTKEICKSDNVFINIRKWSFRFNIEIFRTEYDECSICCEELPALYRTCPFLHITCEECCQKNEGRCFVCFYLLT